jgi:nucleotide-binding universal stress UspA family protein
VEEIAVPIDAMTRREGQKILDKTMAVIDLPKKQVVTEVLVGRPAAEMVGFAETVGADLIVCGRRGLNSLQEFFVGSVSHELIQSATCPVLVVQ